MKKTRNDAKKFDSLENDGFPGYPLYPPSEDITQRAKQVDADLDDPSLKGNNLAAKDAPSEEAAMVQDEDGKIAEPENEFDLTSEDLEALGPKDLSLDMGEDETLKHRTAPVDFSGEDLDVPGSEEEDLDAASGLEDEENARYSLGGDSHEDLEENRSSPVIEP